MFKKYLIIGFLILLYIMLFLFIPQDKGYIVCSITSPLDIKLCDGNVFTSKKFQTFDDLYTEKNKKYAQLFNISNDEAFILGNFGKYWAEKILYGKKIKIADNNLIYQKYDYLAHFENSAFCIKDNKLCNEKAFEREIAKIRKGKFVIADLDSDNTYPISQKNSESVKNFVIVRKKYTTENVIKVIKNIPYTQPSTYNSGNIKIILSDNTKKLIPDRNCSDNICKEIVDNINKTQKTLDIAAYGYSSTPAIENAVKNAQKRGVKIRLVYDLDEQNVNIYPETEILTKLIPDSVNDAQSEVSKNLMHNKFLICDNKTVITGSANFSYTDMSGFNSNAVAVIKSDKIADFYTQEFNQMFSGKFHKMKRNYPNKNDNNISVYFSPQDNAVKNAILPELKGAQDYIYISSFIITEKQIVEELINAKKRGVDIKIILDALNASNQYSKHKELRLAGIEVKTENYAGKMHSKSIIIDNKYTILGSMNFSKAGNNKNDENLVVISDYGITDFYKKFFMYQWNKIPNKWLKYNAGAEGKDSVGSCADGIDNDYDGKIDMEDSACK